MLSQNMGVVKLSVSDIILNFIISFVSGILSGVLLTSKGNPDRPTIIQFHQNIIKTEYREKIIIKREHRGGSSSSNDDVWLFLVISFVIFILAVTVFAKYRDVIIIWGWRTIAFGSSVVITSIIVSFVRERRIEFAGIWTFISWIAIVYIFWVFSNPNLGQDYLNYLSGVKQGNNVVINNYSLFAFVQFLGLLPLVFASIFTFAQSITFALWPMGYNNKILYRLLFKLTGLYDKYLLGIHAFFILFSYFYCSGILARISLSNWNNILK